MHVDVTHMCLRDVVTRGAQGGHLHISVSGGLVLLVFGCVWGGTRERKIRGCFDRIY